MKLKLVLPKTRQTLFDSDLVGEKTLFLNHGIYFCLNYSCSAKACYKRLLILFLWILTKGKFQEETVQFSPITFHIGYLGTVICLELLTSSSISQNFAITSRIIKSVGFHCSQCSNFMEPLLNQRNHIFLFHMRLFSTYLISLAMQCGSLVPALLLHKCFFVCYANAASSILGLDAQLLLYILLLKM